MIYRQFFNGMLHHPQNLLTISNQHPRVLAPTNRLNMKPSFFVLSLVSVTLAADFKAPSPDQVFENLVMGEEVQTSDGRFWSLICGTLGNARGEPFITVSPPKYPPQLITDPTTVQSPFPINLSAYTGRYICFYKMIGNQGRGYFAVTTPGDEFYRTPLPTIRFSAEFNTSLWPPTIKKVSFFYQKQHIGTVRPDTPKRTAKFE